MWSRRLGAAGLASLGLALACFAGTAQSRDKPDGLELFSAMMPVLSNDRCMNCHGVVDPETGEEHAGGKVAGFIRRPFGGNASSTCFACHTQGVTTTTEPVEGEPGHMETRKSGPWELAPREQFFVGKGAAALCQQIKELSGHVTGPEGVMEHLSQDQRIQLGFDGMRGIDQASPAWPVKAEPPPMTKDDFLAAAEAWINDGGMGCGPGWNGTITFMHSMTTSREETLAGGVNDKGGTHTFKEQLEDVTTVLVNNGEGTATRTIRYSSADRFEHTVGGQCSPGAALTWGSYVVTTELTREGTLSLAVPVDISTPPGQDYTVSFAMPLPDEKWVRTDGQKRQVCGPTAKYSGLLPGSGPDRDSVETSVMAVPGSATPIAAGMSATGHFDPAKPDSLHGQLDQAGSTPADGWRLEWNLARN